MNIKFCPIPSGESYVFPYGPGWLFGSKNPSHEIPGPLDEHLWLIYEVFQISDDFFVFELG
jgi:hypothetical protein